MQTKSAAVAFKRQSLTDDGTFTGHGAVFGNVDLGGDMILPGAFRKSLSDHAAEGTSPAMLWSHDPGEPIGRWLKMAEDDIGLRVTGKLTLEVPRAKAAYGLMRDGALGLSIGYSAQKHRYDANGVRVLEAVDLIEVSPVSIPMNPKAKISGVKSITDIRTFEFKLRDALGLSVREARRMAKPAWKALNHGDGSEELDALLDAIETKLSRGYEHERF